MNISTTAEMMPLDAAPVSFDIFNIFGPFTLRLNILYKKMMTDYFYDNQTSADMIISAFITIGVYWFVGAIYTAIDITRKPQFLVKFKIQENYQNKVNFKRVAMQTLSNQLLAMCFGLGFLKIRSTYFPPQEFIPDPIRIVAEILAAMTIREVFFYYTHRMFHHPRIYKYVHKRHHEFYIPMAMAGIYCHPLEHIITNTIPIMIGPLLLHSHSFTFYVWQLYVMILTLNDHCGYHFPLTTSPRFHDYHHWKFNTNYGIMGYMDWFHGTDASFRNYKYYKFDKVHFSLTPLEKTEIE